MKWILFFNLVVLLGFTLADIQEHTLKRVARDTFSDMGSDLLFIEAAIVSNCKINGHINETNQLQSAYDEMKTCFKKKTILITPEDEFIANIEECSKESIKRTKSCLASDQKYFPELALDLVKSGISFIYKNVEIIRVDLAACVPRFNKYSVQRSYIQCLTDVSIRTHDSSQVPTSKASFCDKFIPASRCFTDMIKETCDRTTNVDQFREDYINAMKGPCDKKE